MDVSGDKSDVIRIDDEDASESSSSDKSSSTWMSKRIMNKTFGSEV